MSSIRRSLTAALNFLDFSLGCGGIVGSRLVLGGASFGKISQSEVDSLLRVAEECGITRIDTAPGYPDSEKRIGNYLKSRKTFRVNTKVGLPDPSVFTPHGIKDSVENSLRDLRVEQIGTLFIHSLDLSYLTDENLGALVRLKKEGKVERVGYSGDGVNLYAALQRSELDDFMMTFNIIDQSNADAFAKVKINQGIYVKVPLAQAIWTSYRIDRRIASLKIVRRLFDKPDLPITWLDYKMRFGKFKRLFLSKDYASEFLRFALIFGRSDQNVVLGTNSVQHIRDAAHTESQQIDREVMSRYTDLWAQEGSTAWESHT